MNEVFQQALAAHHAGDYAAAERGYLELRQYRNALQNLGALYNELSRYADGEAIQRRLIQDFPAYAPAQHSLSMALLAQRRYVEGWRLYEARREVLAIPTPQGLPEWDGGPLEGRTLAVCVEQGFGDQLMFARYLPLLQARGAKVRVACHQPAIGSLFEAAGYETTPLRLEPGGLPGADAWVLMGSLPFRLGVAQPPRPWNELHLPPVRGGGVGVVVKGNPTHRHDRQRSLPPEAAQALLALGRDLHPEATGAADFLETARIIAGLDLVVTVDTSVAHLAGALGKPCWVLLPAAGLDFRWNGGAASDWYPEMRLFRQSAPGDWTPVLARVREALEAL